MKCTQSFEGRCLWPSVHTAETVRERCFMGRLLETRRWNREVRSGGRRARLLGPREIRHRDRLLPLLQHVFRVFVCVFPCLHLTLKAEALSKVQLRWLLDIDRFLWSKANTHGSFLRPSAVFVPSLSLQSVVLIFITPHHVTSVRSSQTKPEHADSQSHTTSINNFILV